MRTVFDQLDVDSNGYLVSLVSQTVRTGHHKFTVVCGMIQGAADLSVCLRSIGENMDDDVIDELIREADNDGDGQVG